MTRIVAEQTSLKLARTRILVDAVEGVAEVLGQGVGCHAMARSHDRTRTIASAARAGPMTPPRAQRPQRLLATPSDEHHHGRRFIPDDPRWPATRLHRLLVRTEMMKVGTDQVLPIAE
jgi:hypothetical protein